MIWESPAAWLWAADLSSPATFKVWPLDSCLNRSSLIVSRSAGYPPALAVLTCRGKECRGHSYITPLATCSKPLDTTASYFQDGSRLNARSPKERWEGL